MEGFGTEIGVEGGESRVWNVKVCLGLLNSCMGRAGERDSGFTVYT